MSDNETNEINQETKSNQTKKTKNRMLFNGKQ